MKDLVANHKMKSERDSEINTDGRKSYDGLVDLDMKNTIGQAIVQMNLVNEIENISIE